MFIMQKVPYSALSQQPRNSLQSIVPLPMPFTIYLDVTNICNFRCVCCPHSVESYREKGVKLSTISLESFNKILNDIEQIGVLKTCNLYAFGEPLINPHLPFFIKTIKDRQLAEKTILSTNASLLTPQKSEEILLAGLDYIRISIYGVTQELHEKRTQSTVKLEQIVHNIAEFKNLRDKLKAHTHIAIKMLDFGDTNERVRFFEMFKEYADECVVEYMYNFVPTLESSKFHGESNNISCNSLTICPFPFYTLNINADLSVSVCCIDWHQELTVGNLNTQSLKEIWNGEALHNVQLALLRQDFINIPVCKTCTLFNITAVDDISTLSAEEYQHRLNAL